MKGVKEYIYRLRSQKHDLKRFRHSDSLVDWFDKTREIVRGVLRVNADLETLHGPVWEKKNRQTLTFEDRAPFENSLDGIIRSLNRTEEVNFFKSPIVVLTLIGILFMLLVAGGTFLYFVFFL